MLYFHQKDLAHFSSSAIETITITYSYANETTVPSPLKLLEHLDCHLDYREQEEILSQKLHLAPKVEGLRKRNRVSQFPLTVPDFNQRNVCSDDR